MKKQTCCIFGHRKINLSDEQKELLKTRIENLIAKEGVRTFLFGSRSQFDDLCLSLVSELHEKYPYVKRVYVRAEYPIITQEYENYLLRRYDETYFPKSVAQAGRARYVERNYIMIDNSNVCLIYYDENCEKKVSGTYRAYNYAEKKGRKIINVFSRECK